MNWRVPLADLDYGSEEREAVDEVLDKKWLTMGEVTRQLEEEFASLVGTKHALAVSNGTHALHLACLALEIGSGDEVILPSLTFVATANAALYTGASVRFADIISPREPNIDPEEVERLITPKTRAILVMHYGGYPCRMNEIEDIARRKDIAIIEDAAHAPGGTYRGRALGNWSQVGCFSFFSNKNMATGEGGMVVTNDDKLAEKVKLLRSHGMTTLTWERHQGHAYSYDVLSLGFNYRIDEIRSALGLVQLKKLKKNNLRREQITQQYWGAFSYDDIETPFQDAISKGDSQPAYHLFPILLPRGAERRAFMQHLRQAGIQTSIHYPPIHTFSYYREKYPQVKLPHTEDYASREVTLPLYPSMTDEQVNMVIRSVKEGLRKS